MEILVRAGVQEEANGPFVPGPFRLVHIEDGELELQPGTGLMGLVPADIEAASRVAVRAAMCAAMADPRMGEAFTDAEGGDALRILRIWKCEMWSNPSSAHPPRDADGNVKAPEFVLNFDPREETSEFDWGIFDAVLATLHRADDERLLAERALVSAVRDAWNKHGVRIAQLALRIGWSPEYTRLVAKGERLTGLIVPTSTQTVHTLHSPAGGGCLVAGAENPAALIAAAATLLARAQALLGASEA